MFKDIKIRIRKWSGRSELRRDEFGKMTKYEKERTDECRLHDMMDGRIFLLLE